MPDIKCVWLVYRITRLLDSDFIQEIKPIEYCTNDAEASRDCKLLNLQTPADLKDRVTYKCIHAYAINKLKPIKFELSDLPMQPPPMNINLNLDMPRGPQ